MATPDPTVWARDPHTEAKHRLLSGYWAAWLPILLQVAWTTRITIADFAAGPGEYLPEPEDPRPLGSPLLAMKALVDQPALLELRKPVTFGFLEVRPDRVDHLRSLVGELHSTLPPYIRCEVREGDYRIDSLPLLDGIGAWGHPIFALIDPFNACVPLDLVTRLGQNPTTEVFVTLMSDRLRRFAGSATFTEGDETFGSSAWREVRQLDDPATKEAFLVDQYRATLRRVGFPKTAVFKLLDEGGRAFWLLYGTGNRTGLERMKDSMWKVDPVRGIRFRDPRDRDQLQMFTDWQPDLGTLRVQVLEYLEKIGRTTVDDVRNFALEETSYRSVHAVHVLRDLVAASTVGRLPAKGQLTRATEVWLVGPDVPSLFDGY